MPAPDVIAHPTTGIRDMTRFKPGWTRFFQSIADAEADAGARGKRFGVDLSGIGNGVSQRQRGSAISTPLRQLAGGGGGSDDTDPLLRERMELENESLRQQNFRAGDDHSYLQSQRSNALDQLTRGAGTDFDLFSGRAGKRMGAAGDIMRGEQVRDAENAGVADVAQYWAPGAREVRQQRLWDKERELQTAFPFSKALTDADRARDVAQITGGSRVAAAQATGDARRDSAALSALARTGGAMVMPGSEGRLDAAQGAIMPNVPGQGPAPGSKGVFPAARLQQFAQEKGFASPEQARQYLEQVAGYRVQ
jgi:hypothetical protein